jgi:uncharacterized protein
MVAFHLAFPVTDLVATKDFFINLLGAKLGREADKWADFDFYGHQLSAHLVEQMPNMPTNPVDGKQVPVAHFGLILPWHDWHALKERLDAENTDYLIAPYIRFAGQPGEQATLFIEDPSGNGLEFKSFKDPAKLFAVD